MFHALVGHSLKEYIRKRRLSEAAARLVTTQESLIQIAFDFQFGTQESFTRAFRSMFGITPGRFRKIGKASDPFPALNVIDLYLSSDEVNSLDPRIKVLKTLEPVRVASCRAFSESPEIDAWRTIMSWADDNGRIGESSGFRLFGFDNPGPQGSGGPYGYECCMTLHRPAESSGNVRIKTLPGGLYAVTPTTVGEIGAAWDHFVKWQAVSKYHQATHQCLEEHLNALDEPGENTSIDLYLPIKPPQHT
jgi:AraC family transcriptional regulator